MQHPHKESWPVLLDGSLLKSLIKQRFRRVQDFQDQWAITFPAPVAVEPAPSKKRAPKFGPSKTTVYRWGQGGWPRTDSEVLHLARLLDVDPICLFAVTPKNSVRTARAVMDGYQRNKWDPPRLRLLKQFVGPRTDWPPLSFADDLKRCWVVHEVDHDFRLGKNFYALFTLNSPKSEHLATPQTYHFAFRHGSKYDTIWVQYGYVVRHGSDIRLIDMNGVFATAVAGDGPTLVETHFGAQPTQFRVASLHDFTLSISRSRGKSGAVRFP